MAKLYVVMSGLIALALPKTERQGATLLLLRHSGDHNDHGSGMPTGGGVIPPHHAQVVFRPRDLKIGGKPSWDWNGERAFWSLQGEDVRFLPEGGEPCPWIKLENEKYFAHFETVLGDPSKARIKRGCLGCNPHEECLRNGRPALAGRARLSEGIIRPVNIAVERKVVECTVRENLWEFRSICDPRVKTEFLGELFGALMFEMELQSCDDFCLEIGGTKIPLYKESLEDFSIIGCDKQDKEQLVVWIENLPFSREHSAEDDVVIDRHFELLYDLLENNADHRFVPFRKVHKRGIKTDPPGVRCIPGAATS